MIRWAIFLPMPGAAVSALASSVTTASASCWGVMADRIASAALGPTPDTLMSSLKLRSSFWSMKPNSSMASSRTFRYVYSLAGAPFFSCDRV